MKLEKYLEIRYIYILSIVNCALMIYIFKVDVSFDSYTYIDAWSTFQGGSIDKWRTPVYPMFLGITKFVCGDNYLWCVVFIQNLVYLVSIKYFFFLMQYSVENKKISLAFTFFYALYPCVSTYNCCIVTESLAVSGAIFLLYSIVKLYTSKKTVFGFFPFFWLLFLIFLRPAVVYLLPVTMVWWCIIVIKRKGACDKPFICGMVGTILVSINLFVYIIMFKGSYGVFAPSGVGLINKYAIAKAANLIDLNATKREQLLFYQEAEKYINEMGMDNFSDLVSLSINQNKAKYAMRIIQNVRNASEENLFEPSYLNGYIGVVSNIIGAKIKMLYFLFIFYFLFLLRWMIKHRDIPFFSCLLFMIGISNYIVIVIASPGEYGRLSLPAIPVYLIMVGQLLRMIRMKTIAEVKFV